MTFLRTSCSACSGREGYTTPQSVTGSGVVPDAKTQFKLQFDFVRAIDNLDVVKALIARGDKELLAAVETAGVEEDAVDADAPVAVAKSGKY